MKDPLWHKPLFHQGHHNILAAEFRKHWFINGIDSTDRERAGTLAHNAAMGSLLLDLAKRFKEDNPHFDPHKWLDACSPDVDLYPLSELWED